MTRVGGRVGLGQVFPEGRSDVQQLCEISHGVLVPEDLRIQPVEKVRMWMDRAVGKVGDGEKGQCSCPEEDGVDVSLEQVAESDVGDS